MPNLYLPEPGIGYPALGTDLEKVDPASLIDDLKLSGHAYSVFEWNSLRSRNSTRKENRRSSLANRATACGSIAALRRLAPIAGICIAYLNKATFRC